MKTRPLASVACCAALLIIVPPMTTAATKTLGLANAEPQYASHLCWAAANVLAVNNFYHCPLSPPATPPPPPPPPPLFPTSQGLEAGYYAWSHSHTPPDPTKLGGFLSSCEGNIQSFFCNGWEFPLDTEIPPLHGLTFQLATDPMGLDWDTMTHEIDAGRPVLFMWDYPPNGTSPDSPVGAHELVVTGYSDERPNSTARWLQIFDPWPVPMLPPNNLPPSHVPACGPASGVAATPQHSTWILFSTYGNPKSDMGVTAEHSQDQWDLVPIPVPEPPTGFSVDHAPPPPPRAPLPPFFKFVHPASQRLTKVSFAEARRAVVPPSQLELQVSGGAPRSLGVPFPIVGLGFVQLLHAGDDPTGLLAGSTSAILFPVESKGEVVDAFLMLLIEGRWQRGGYANLEITQRLVDVRARYAAKKHVPLESFYMVSVPGEVAFFAAYGKGKNAVLIPATTDPLIRAVAGQAAPAALLLNNLIHEIKDDLRPQQARGADTGRPRQ